MEYPSKNLIDDEARKEAQPDKFPSHVGQKDQPLNDGVNLVNNDEIFSITLTKKFINKSNRTEIQNLLSLASSPMFLKIPNENEVGFGEFHPTIKEKSNIVIFMDMLHHYTGGRYSIFQQAVLLGEHFGVTLVTDKKPPFVNDFKSYSGFGNVKIVVDPNWLQSYNKNPFDLVIGIPNVSAQYAHEYAKKFRLPFYCYMFESPNYVSEFRDGVDATEEFWANFKRTIVHADMRITPSKTSMEYLKKWLGSDDGKYGYVYPCFNKNVADRFLDTPESRKATKIYDLVMLSRIAEFKNPAPIFKLLNKMLKSKIRVAIVGRNLTNFDFVNTFDKIEIDLFDTGINDEKKYKILSQSKIGIVPSKFEGYGMPPQEFLYFNVPCIAYDLPVLREVYGDKISYVKTEKNFAIKIFTMLKSYKPVNKPTTGLTTPEVTKEQFLKLLPIKNEPKVAIGILAFNCIDYLDSVIRSVYDVVDQIIIVEGAVGNMKHCSNNSGHSIDGTFDAIINDELYDPDKKIKIVMKRKGYWKNKIEMQNEIAKRVRAKYYIKMDADEIWKPETVTKIVKFLDENENIDVIRMPFHHFWTSFGIVATDSGGKWSTKHPRVWRWRETFRHISSFNFFVDKATGNKVDENSYNYYVWKNDHIYHMGYARTNERVDEKLKYYGARKIENFVDKNRYKNWKDGDKTQPTQDTPSGSVKFSRKDLPTVLKEHYYYKLKDIRGYNG